MSINIAIDGPAGAEKAPSPKSGRKAGIIFMWIPEPCTGRLPCTSSGRVAPEDKEAIAKECAGADVSITYQNGEQVVSLNGENVNGLHPYRGSEKHGLRGICSAGGAGAAAAICRGGWPPVQNVLMDGRDIGTCILPDADVKIFLTASTAVRAKTKI